MNKNIFLEKKWIVLIQALPRRERFFAWGLIVVSAIGLLAWLIALYISATMPIPKAGGKYIEGIVGQPAYINPLLSQTSESDADLSALVYAGLFVHDASGQPVPRLAESFSISPDGKEYTVKLRENIRSTSFRFWFCGCQFGGNGCSAGWPVFWSGGLGGCGAGAFTG